MTRRAARLPVAVAVVLVVAGGLPVPALARTERELVADALGQAFTLRASVDMGGAAKIPFFLGSYADANLTSPPAGADGQASFYNLGIAETAIFTAPGECTQDEQQARIEQAMNDVTTWLQETAIPTILHEHEVPVAPIPTLPCSERFPGFAQSRYPSTGTIQESADSDLLGEALCSDPNGCAVAESLAPVTGGVLAGGRFVARATSKPSQSSDATVLGITVPGVLSIGSARSIAFAAIDGDRLIARASWTATDVCVAPDPAGCALAIRGIRQLATVERDAAGKVLARTSRTVIAGLEGGGQATEVTAEVTAEDLQPGLPPIDLGGRLQIRAVPTTGGCGDPSRPNVADAGGFEIFGQGQGTGVTLPVPLLGTATGGGILIGGACASGRFAEVSFEVPAGSVPGSLGDPGRTIALPPGAGTVPPSTIAGPQLSPPRVVRKSVVRYDLRSAPAWRTARYWGSALAALALLGVLAFVFRRSRPLAPVVAAADRFARQFIRG